VNQRKISSMRFKDVIYKNPVLTLEIQREIVGRIKTARKIVEGNRELIQIAAREAKIKQVIAKVWEG